MEFLNQVILGDILITRVHLKILSDSGMDKGGGGGGDHGLD